MQTHLVSSAAICGLVFAHASLAQSQPESEPKKELGVVTITGSKPSSLPTQIPSTMHSVNAQTLQQTVNSQDSEDALKYFPSLLVRKRYPGDYNHAVLSSRASGTGNSARSAVYADGISLSNLLGNGVGGLSFAPRWNMVTPSEIERVDVMYGPFSAAYPGNSVGAIVDYKTRMPQAWEVDANLSYHQQPFKLYQTNSTYRSWQSGVSVGNRQGDWAWRLHVQHDDNQGQPLTFASRLVSSGTTPVSATATPVTGAVQELNTANVPIYILGTGTQYHSQQNHAKAKLSWDMSSGISAHYLAGVWTNESSARPQSYLTGSNGQTVYSGPIVIQGRQYAALTGGDFARTEEELRHWMQAITLKTNTRGKFDWEVQASQYHYGRDDKRQTAASNTLPNADSGGTGTLAHGNGSGWNTLALKGTWRSGESGKPSAHVVDMGLQRDQQNLRYQIANLNSNWLTEQTGPVSSDIQGSSSLQSLWLQDTWRISPNWKTVLGARHETWRVNSASTLISGANLTSNWPERTEHYVSPKAAISYAIDADLVAKAAVGRAVRMPTLSELFGATATSNSRFINDPTLRPEKSLTAEWTLESEKQATPWRVTAFMETTKDALFTQTVFDINANTNISRVQNVGKIDSRGLELVGGLHDLGIRGLSIQSSLTYTHSIIKENSGFVSVAGDTIGKRQPNIPRWRASTTALYQWNDSWSTSAAVRYSSQQFRTLNNSDVNGNTYQGVSPFLTADMRVLYKVAPKWTLAMGIDNLNNARYWNFHPYPQRSYHLELKYALR
jgi:iron complex outermembrane recepter protein